jgi:hypothetical protein
MQLFLELGPTVYVHRVMPKVRMPQRFEYMRLSTHYNMFHEHTTLMALYANHRWRNVTQFLLYVVASRALKVMQSQHAVLQSAGAEVVVLPFPFVS